MYFLVFLNLIRVYGTTNLLSILKITDGLTATKIQNHRTIETFIFLVISSNFRYIFFGGRDLTQPPPADTRLFKVQSKGTVMLKVFIHFNSLNVFSLAI